MSSKVIICGQDERVGKWVCERTHGTWTTDSRTVGLEEDGKLIAGVQYDMYNGASVCMHVAAEGRGWLNREYLWFCFYYPFEQLKVNTIIGLVPSWNEAARKFDENLGFTVQTIIPKATPNGDLWVYTMCKEQCRFLRDNYHGRKIQRTSNS